MDTSTYTVSDGHGGSASANVTVQVRNLVDVAGRVFDDSDNDGAYEPDNGDVGIGGVIVQLFNRISGDGSPPKRRRPTEPMASTSTSAPARAGNKLTHDRQQRFQRHQ